jgi:hypothetical protein
MSAGIKSNSSGNLELYSGSTKILTADATTGVASFSVAPIAPTAAAIANNTQLATTAMVHSAITNDLNVTGSAPMYACRAWVNFDGTASSPTPRASGNVSSITKNGTGWYTVNFATAMPDANYSISGTCAVSGSKLSLYPNPDTSKITASGVDIEVATSGSTTSLSDGSFVTVAIYR